MKDDKAIGYIEFQNQFKTEEDCRQRLIKIRFPNGYICPKCGSIEHYSIKTRNLYQCKGCRYQLSLTAGTIMHRSHLSLLIWFWAIYLVSKDKRGYSATQLSKELDLPYNTAWFLLHRIRSAMTQRDENYQLSGIVELDDTYLGKPKKGGKRGRGTKKTKVIVAVSKTDDGKPIYIKMQVVENLKSDTIAEFAVQNIAQGTKVETDAYHSYRKPLAQNYEHYFEVFDANSDLLHWLHIVVSNVKAFVSGTFHGLGHKHLQRYLDEFCYRFNRRFFKDAIFNRLLIAAVSASPFTLADLT